MNTINITGNSFSYIYEYAIYTGEYACMVVAETDSLAQQVKVPDKQSIRCGFKHLLFRSEYI